MSTYVHTSVRTGSIESQAKPSIHSPKDVKYEDLSKTTKAKDDKKQKIRVEN
jgi:hypothetical protein